MASLAHVRPGMDASGGLRQIISTLFETLVVASFGVRCLHHFVSHDRARGRNWTSYLSHAEGCSIQSGRRKVLRRIRLRVLYARSQNSIGFGKTEI
jgi:hypothetical protein